MSRRRSRSSEHPAIAPKKFRNVNVARKSTSGVPKNPGKNTYHPPAVQNFSDSDAEDQNSDDNDNDNIIISFRKFQKSISENEVSDSTAKDQNSDDNDNVSGSGNSSNHISDNEVSDSEAEEQNSDDDNIPGSGNSSNYISDNEVSDSEAKDQNSDDNDNVSSSGNSLNPISENEVSDSDTGEQNSDDNISGSGKSSNNNSERVSDSEAEDQNSDDNDNVSGSGNSSNPISENEVLDSDAEDKNSVEKSEKNLLSNKLHQYSSTSNHQTTQQANPSNDCNTIKKDSPNRTPVEIEKEYWKLVLRYNTKTKHGPFKSHQNSNANQNGINSDLDNQPKISNKKSENIETPKKAEIILKSDEIKKLKPEPGTVQPVQPGPSTSTSTGHGPIGQQNVQIDNSNNDCVHFFKPAGCFMDEDCSFRHSEAALGCYTECDLWKLTNGKCSDWVLCSKRHMKQEDIISHKRKYHGTQPETEKAGPSSKITKPPETTSTTTYIPPQTNLPFSFISSTLTKPWNPIISANVNVTNSKYISNLIHYNEQPSTNEIVLPLQQADFVRPKIASQKVAQSSFSARLAASCAKRKFRAANTNTSAAPATSSIFPKPFFVHQPPHVSKTSKIIQNNDQPSTNKIVLPLQQADYVRPKIGPQKVAQSSFSARLAASCAKRKFRAANTNNPAVPAISSISSIFPKSMFAHRPPHASKTAKIITSSKYQDRVSGQSTNLILNPVKSTNQKKASATASSTVTNAGILTPHTATTTALIVENISNFRSRLDLFLATTPMLELMDPSISAIKNQTENVPSQNSTLSTNQKKASGTASSTVTNAGMLKPNTATTTTAIENGPSQNSTLSTIQTKVSGTTSSSTVTCASSSARSSGILPSIGVIPPNSNIEQVISSSSANVASQNTSGVSVENKKNSSIDLECPICLEDFESIKAKNLSLMFILCGHIVCSVCCADITKLKPLKANSCPVCRKPITQKPKPCFL